MKRSRGKDVHMNKVIMDVINKTCDVYDSITFPKEIVIPNDMKLSEVIKGELALFMMYLSASDGTITKSEAGDISEMLEKTIGTAVIPPELISKYMQQNNIYSTEFESRAPSALVLSVFIDNALVRLGQGENAKLSQVVIDTYKMVGESFINASGAATENELANYNTYIKMMETYRDQNFTGMEDAVVGFTKSGAETDQGDKKSGSSGDNTVPAPAKKSVKAPRKG